MAARRTVRIPPAIEPLLRRIGRIAAAQGVSAYAVGGCVRDWLLGIPTVTDVDVTVKGSGIVVARAVAARLGGNLTTHEAFGTATVTLASADAATAIRGPGGRGITRIDFASTRRERYARPGAYPRVAAGTLAEDLRRRDFTINAMAAAITPDRFGALYDPAGGGADLRRRRLRALHARSFVDDPSRLLRGVRFAERFGLRWERRTARAARAAMTAGALGWLNAGRLGKELDRMCEEPDPRACLQRLARLLRG